MITKPYKLAIIEDQTDMIEVVEMIVEQHYGDGVFKVESYSNCKQALEAILKNGADVVISDINMPEMHGDSIFRQIKESNKRVIFIYLSGDTRKTLMMNAYLDGARYFVSKPFKLDELTKILDNCIYELDHWYNKLHYR